MVAKILLRTHIPKMKDSVNLDALERRRFQFVALPLKIAEADGSPVRAIALLE